MHDQDHSTKHSQWRIIFLVVLNIGLLGIVVFFAGRLLQELRTVGSTPSSVSVPADKAQDDAPLFFSTMTHLEGGWVQALASEGFFDRQADYLRQAYAYAEEYDAVLTIESEIPMAEAMVKWDDNLLQEALDRGQSVGTHCDITPNVAWTDEEMVEEVLKRKQAVDALVSPLENLGCSGGGGLGDWYEGMVGAGFKYVGGVVGYHYLALNPSEYPQGWDRRSILQEYYHEPAPQANDLRYYPFRVSKVGFESDDEGELVVSAGSIAKLTAMAESQISNTWDGGCDGSCPLTPDDVDALVTFIREFDGTRDLSHVAKLGVYLPTEIFAEEHIEYFFSELQSLQEGGVITWAGQKDVYEAFVVWENAQK